MISTNKDGLFILKGNTRAYIILLDDGTGIIGEVFRDKDIARELKSILEIADRKLVKK